jgi:2-phosphoglycerate kinase
MRKKKKHILYVVGGLSRTGKTIVAGSIMRRKHLVVIPTDAIRAALRKVLIGESRVSVERISFRSAATYRRPGSLRKRRIVRVRKTKREDDLAWIGVRGLIETYDRKNMVDVLLEGIAITPERIGRLKLKNLKVRAVFLGYSSISHGAAMLAYSRRKHDWVNTWIKEHGGDESHVHEWVRKGISRSAAIEKAAKKFGYRYFDISRRPFKEQIGAAVDYLLA